MLGLWITIAAVVGLLVGAVGIYLFLSNSAKNVVGLAKSEAERSAVVTALRRNLS